MVQIVREVDLTTVAVGAGRATVLNRWRNGDAVATLVGKARDLVAKGLLATLVELRKPLDASAQLKGGRNLAQTHYGASAAEVLLMLLVPPRPRTARSSTGRLCGL